jgi:hypothetical protein
MQSDSMKRNLSSLCISSSVYPPFSFIFFYGSSNLYFPSFDAPVSFVIGYLRRDIEPYITKGELYAKGKTINDVDAVDAVCFRCTWCSKMP